MICREKILNPQILQGWIFKMFSNRWGHRALSVPSLVESSPRVVPLRQKPTEDLTAWRMCNSLFLLRNPASFMKEEVRRHSFSLRSCAEIPPFTACSLTRASVLCSQSFFLQFFSDTADGSRQGRDWGSGSHMRSHGEQGKNWFGKWEDLETHECLSALTQQLQRGIHHRPRGMISYGRW